MTVLESKRHLRVLGERPTKSKSQRLERHGTQGELKCRVFKALLIHSFDARPD
jgi:hypothetical protein